MNQRTIPPGFSFCLENRNVRAHPTHTRFLLVYQCIPTLLLVLGLGAFVPWSALAQSIAADTTTSGEEVPFAVAARHETPPTLDGDVLGDPIWSEAPSITGFWQTTPNEGEPASERTEVRILYTDRALYVGVVCYDREPDGIIVSDSRRDAPLDETDSFRLIFDTYLDGQNGFVFGTNPAGIEYDAQVTKEGEGGFAGRQQAGSGAGFNINWDGSWDVRTQITDIGWSAEFEIPFRTLRFPAGDSQTWGVNFQRNIRRRNEEAFWSKLPRQYSLNRVSRAGRLSGLEVPQPRNLQVMPYVLGQASRDYTAADSKTDGVGDFGVDLKYSITPSMTLDATYNTDFAQVEVDEQQINLDRFSLFFPEKRPFFLENAGLFSVGVSESMGQEVELFFSRRIGIGPDGEAIPILGGARLSGQVAGLNVGLLNMQTEEVAGVAPANNFSVARIRKDLPNRTSFGAFVANRLSTTTETPSDPDIEAMQDDNQTVALDGRVGIGQYGQLSGFVARTFSPHLNGDEYAYNVSAEYNSEAWLLNATFTEVAENFNPEMGFLRRSSAYRKFSGLVFHTYRPENILGLHELRPHVSYQGYWDFDGFQETGRWHIDNHWEWESGFEVHTGLNLTREGVKEAFVISEEDSVVVQPGTYDHQEAQIVLMTNQGKKISLNTTNVIGGFFGGDRVNLRGTLRVRANEMLTTEFTLSYNDISLPGGDFTTNLFQARVSYSFTPRLYVQGLFQYNDSGDLWSANLRFGWLQAANTGLFIVFNESSGIDDFFGNPQARSITLKYSRLFNVLR